MTRWAAVALLGCGVGAPATPPVGHPACAEVAGLEPGDEYLEGGHLVRVTASGADDRGAATLGRWR
ncbi:MAG: hypothetical protein ABMA64_22075 [Myxococcota bacterium]